MNFLVKEKSFYRQLASIAIPIMLQNLIGFGVSVTDTVMVGRLGDMPLSGTSLGNQPFFIFMIFGFGLASGGTVLIAQYWGRGERQVVRRVMGISIRFIAIISLVFAAVCHIFPEAILCIFSSEEPVIAEGAKYLKWVALSYPFYGLSNCYLTSMRAVERVKFPAFVYGVSFFVNIFVNWVFIFGKLGAPALGVVGAAIGTIAARIVELAIVMVYTSFIEDEINFKYTDLFKWEKALLPDYLRHSLPVVGSELLWSLGTVVQTVFIGHIGSVFVTANSIAGTVQQLANVALFGVGNAAAVITGKAIGEGREEDAKKMGKTLLLIAIGVGFFACGLIYLIRRPMVGFYNVSQEARDTAMQILGVMGFIMIGSAVELTCMIGILRGAGDTKFAFIVDTCCLWLVGVPLGYLAGFVWKLPIVFVYMCMRADIPVRVTVCLIRIFRGKYIKNVTRDVESE